MTGRWAERRRTPRARPDPAEAGETDRVPPAPRTTPRERVAVLVVALLCLTSGLGTAAYAVNHTLELAGPPLIGAAPGGPPTGDVVDPASAGPSTSARTRSSTKPTAKATRKPAGKPTRKVVIPANAAAKYVLNTDSAKAASGPGRVITFDVRVQKGLPYDADEIARAIAATLGDHRSWRADGRQRFRLVRGGGQAELHAYVVTPGTTDQLCAPLLTRGEVSCRQGDKVVLNARRWAFGVPYFKGDLPLYRQYLVNHEFGHYLGYGHVGCPGQGRAAPVMMQQTKGLDGCKANAWPYPKD